MISVREPLADQGLLTLLMLHDHTDDDRKAEWGRVYHHTGERALRIKSYNDGRVNDIVQFKIFGTNYLFPFYYPSSDERAAETLTRLIDFDKGSVVELTFEILHSADYRLKERELPEEK